MSNVFVNAMSDQLKIRIEVQPILGGRDLHPLSDNDMNGTKRYFVEPHTAAFGNGLFSLPIECARSSEGLALGFRILETVQTTTWLKDCMER